jgi:hypothetical protein
MDWTDILAEGDDSPSARFAAELLASAAYDGIEARTAAFVAQRGGCRATFDDCRRELEGGNGTAPEGVQDDSQDACEPSP